jgi:molybdate transport system substrate-binding protein
MTELLYVKSAGAARGLIGSVSDVFTGRQQIELSAQFGAVGTTFDRVREAMLAHDRCDLAVLTPALVRRLQDAFPQRVSPGGSLGSTVTCLACRGDAQSFDIATVDALRRTLSKLDVIFTGDTQQSTVGRHLSLVLERLGLVGELCPDVVSFAGGADAVAALGTAAGKRALACAQLTEVRQHPEAVFVGPFPEAFHLATEYVLAIIDNGRPARDFAAFLTGSLVESARRESGFDPT